MVKNIIQYFIKYIKNQEWRKKYSAYCHGGVKKLEYFNFIIKLLRPLIDYQYNYLLIVIVVSQSTIAALSSTVEIYQLPV